MIFFIPPGSVGNLPEIEKMVIFGNYYTIYTMGGVQFIPNIN